MYGRGIYAFPLACATGESDCASGRSPWESHCCARRILVYHWTRDNLPEPVSNAPVVDVNQEPTMSTRSNWPIFGAFFNNQSHRMPQELRRWVRSTSNTNRREQQRIAVDFPPGANHRHNSLCPSCICVASASSTHSSSFYNLR